MQAWENFLAKQENELGQETVTKWLKPLKVLRFDACNLHLEAQDSFQVLWFEEHIRQKVNSKFINNNNKKIKIHLSVADSVKVPIFSKTKEKKGKESTSQYSPPPFSLTFSELNPHYTFKQFVVSESNNFAYQLLKEVSSEKNKKTDTFNPIYVYGGTGTGKTHLLISCAHAMKKKGLNIIYAHADTFTEHVVSAIRAGTMSTFRQAYRNIDVLILDNVHVFSRKGATQEEFFHTFNTLHLHGKQIILSANCSPQELQLIEARLISRFEWGVVLPLEMLKKDEMAQVLQNRAAALNFELSPEVADFLLNTFVSNVKSLIKALEALILRSHLNENGSKSKSTDITEAIAKNFLADLMIEEEQAAVTPTKIIQAVAEHHGLRPEDILGKAQTRDCVLPRQMAMYLCRDKLGMPFVKIGDLFSRDHSTVMSSVKQIKKILEGADKEVEGSLTKITKKLEIF